MPADGTSTAAGVAGLGDAGVRHFTLRSARSGALVVGISIALVAETLALHLLLVRRHPFLAWFLSTLSAGTLLWLVLDYRAIAEQPIAVAAGRATFGLGNRFRADVALDDIASAIAPTWRDLPSRGPGYLQLASGTPPNVLVTFRRPVAFRGPAGITRQVERLGMRVDEPAALIDALKPPAAASAPR